jgi:hypothetical protein
MTWHDDHLIQDHTWEEPGQSLPALPNNLAPCSQNHPCSLESAESGHSVFHREGDKVSPRLAVVPALDSGRVAFAVVSHDESLAFMNEGPTKIRGWFTGLHS